MEANLCLPTRHFPAMRHHKTVLVHSSVRLPALQAKVGPPPGAARVAVVGAGVVLACAMGAMYWKRVRALQLPMHCRSQTSHDGNGGDHNGDRPGSGIVTPEMLHNLLSEICTRKLDPKPPQLTELIRQCLDQKDVNPYLMTSLLEEKFDKPTKGQDEYIWGIVLILALISEKKYGKAKEIHNKLIPIAIPSDAMPDLLLAIINMMMSMESMLQFPDNKTSTDDLKNLLEEVKKAWEEYKIKAPLQAAPPPTTNN